MAADIETVQEIEICPLCWYSHTPISASRTSRALLGGLAGVPDLKIVELYALYPDEQIDYAVERERMLCAERLVLQFPLQWYSVPSLLKQWMDSVVTPLFYGQADIAIRHGTIWPISIADPSREYRKRRFIERQRGLEASACPSRQEG